MKGKITLKDFQRLKEKTNRRNEIKKIYGIAGTGKTTYMKNLIEEKVKKGEIKDVLILSYTHTGKNELFKKLTGKELGKVNKKNYIYYFGNKRLKISALTFFSFIKQTLEKSNITLERDIEEFLKNYLEDKTYYLKTKKFEEFLKSNSLNVRLRYLINLLNELANVQTNLDKYHSRLFEEFITKKRLILNEDEKKLLILFLENNIFQHPDTRVYDYLNNKEFPLFHLLIKKWGSLLDSDLSMNDILTLRDSIIEEYPFFNLNSFLVFFNKKIEEEELANHLKQEYDLVVVDEAQDTPDYFLKFLFQVLDTDELYLVGDPAQNIYFDLGYSEAFTKWDSNAIILKNIYRYSEELKHFVLSRYPNFSLMWKTKCVPDYKTYIYDIKKEDLYAFLKNNILIKNTNRILKVNENTILYPLYNRTTESILQWFGILDNYKQFALRGVNNEVLKKWLFDVPVSMFLNLQREVIERIRNIENKEKALFLVDLIVEESKKEDLKNVYKAFKQLKEMIRFPKYKVVANPNYHLIFSIFNNTYQSKGRSFSGVIYYNEFGRYYLMKKYLGDDNTFWRFYHSSLEYVAFTRVKKRLYVVS